MVFHVIIKVIGYIIYNVTVLLTPLFQKEKKLTLINPKLNYLINAN